MSRPARCSRISVARLSTGVRDLCVRRCGRFSKDRGATATEYAILVGFVAVVITAGVYMFGQSLNGLYSALAATLTAML